MANKARNQVTGFLDLGPWLQTRLHPDGRHVDFVHQPGRPPDRPRHAMGGRPATRGPAPRDESAYDDRYSGSETWADSAWADGWNGDDRPGDPRGAAQRASVRRAAQQGAGPAMRGIDGARRARPAAGTGHRRAA